jgi:hypothetical protein
MPSGNRPRLRGRVVAASEAALARQGYVSAVDVLMGLGWIHLATVNRWRRGQLPYLEREIPVEPSRIAEAMQVLRSWAAQRSLSPSEAAYIARTPARPALQFSEGGDPTMERLYRTRWVSPKLSEKERERIHAKANRPPELVVIQPLKADWKCHRCGGTGGLLLMEEPGPACLSCAGLGELQFLPAGDAALSRLAKAKSPVHAVVVRFSRSRKRYERQGLLVQPDALRSAERDIRERSRAR